MLLTPTIAVSTTHPVITIASASQGPVTRAAVGTASAATTTAAVATSPHHEQGQARTACSEQRRRRLTWYSHCWPIQACAAGRKLKGSSSGDAACRDEPAECEIPPHVGIPEGLHGEHEHDDRGGANPRETARLRGTALTLGVSDDDEAGRRHWFDPPAGSFASSPQTLFAGYDAGCGGRCSDASLSVGTKAMLSLSW